MNDQYKLQRLEWVFGFPQLVNQKGYRSEKYEYGLERIQRIGDEAYTYISPISGLSAQLGEEPLFSQLLKCKNRNDTFAVYCLQEMLDLMATDNDIARFVYYTHPFTYQYARFPDWIKNYLIAQKQDYEKNNTYQYYKNKYDSAIKGLESFEMFEQKCKVFQAEEEQGFNKFKQTEAYEQIKANWLAYNHSEVTNHFPPQIIIGKQILSQEEEKDKVFLEKEEKDVKVSIYEITNEFNYSNPQNFFNLSIPHIEFKSNYYSGNSYQTFSYTSIKKAEYENEKKRRIEEIKKQRIEEQQDN